MELENQNESYDMTYLVGDGVIDDDIYLICTAECEAAEVMTAMQQARRILKEVRAKQHQVRLSRHYYKVSTETGKMGNYTSFTTNMGINYFKCGNNYKIVNY